METLFDMVSKDPLFGTQTWEAAESTLQKETAGLAIGKAGLTPRDIRMAFAGDLLAQTIASSFGIMGFHTPVYGLYGACSTMGEGLSLASMAVAGGYGEYVAAVTSSHFRQCREGIPFSPGIRKPKTSFCYLDGDGKWGLHFGNKGRKGKDYGNHHRKNLWTLV